MRVNSMWEKSERELANTQRHTSDKLKWAHIKRQTQFSIKTNVSSKLNKSLSAGGRTGTRSVWGFVEKGRNSRQCGRDKNI